MDAIEAITSRHSVRDFSARPVPRETVMRIFEAVMRCPSGGNGQPWEVFVAAGPAMERIRAAYAERIMAGPPAMPGMPPGGPGSAPPPGPGPRTPPPPPPARIMERMRTIREERMRLLGLDPADPASGRVFMEWAARMNGAPVLVVVCMDKTVSGFLDIGMFIQTVCIAAKSLGVDSFIAASLVSQQDVLRRELAIPDELAIVMGIGLGYEEASSIINTYRSPRRPVDEVVRYRED
jgi:nitroreductase